MNKPKYSAKLAAGRSMLGVAVAIIPALITWFLARGYLQPTDAALVTVIVTSIFSALGVDADAFASAKKRAKEDAESL